MQQQTINNMWKQMFEMQMQAQLNGGAAAPGGAQAGVPQGMQMMPPMWPQQMPGQGGAPGNNTQGQK